MTQEKSCHQTKSSADESRSSKHLTQRARSFRTRFQALSSLTDFKDSIESKSELNYIRKRIDDQTLLWACLCLNHHITWSLVDNVTMTPICPGFRRSLIMSAWEIRLLKPGRHNVWRRRDALSQSTSNWNLSTDLVNPLRLRCFYSWCDFCCRCRTPPWEGNHLPRWPVAHLRWREERNLSRNTYIRVCSFRSSSLKWISLDLSPRQQLISADSPLFLNQGVFYDFER